MYDGESQRAQPDVQRMWRRPAFGRGETSGTPEYASMAVYEHVFA